MRSQWVAFLTQKGAVIDHDRILHFGNPDRELQTAITGDILCDLSHQGLIALSGPDTEQFLQGQVTSDVSKVTLEHSQLSAHCNPKGRMLASFRIFRRDDVYYLRLPREMLDSTLKRLRMFVLRAKAVLEDASDTLVSTGLSGPNAETLLQAHLSQVPVQVDEVVQAEGITVIRLPGIYPRFEIYAERKDMQKLWTALVAQTTPVGPESWKLLNIQAGIPTIYPETTDTFVPQMTNLHLMNGVSFKKGCYTGQEIVARSQYLGKLKRRMYRAHVNSNTRPHPGDGLFSPQTDPNQSAGKIVNAASHPQDGYEVLAVVLIGCAEGNAVLLGDDKGPQLEFESLPYAVDAAM